MINKTLWKRCLIAHTFAYNWKFSWYVKFGLVTALDLPKFYPFSIVSYLKKDALLSAMKRLSSQLWLTAHCSLLQNGTACCMNTAHADKSSVYCGFLWRLSARGSVLSYKFDMCLSPMVGIWVSASAEIFSFFHLLSCWYCSWNLCLRQWSRRLTFV
jgi:hypothetical protein